MLSGVKHVRQPNGQFAKGSDHLVSHGRSKTRLYGRWLAMRSRCENPNHEAYPDYGGHGISICTRWKRFENFLADMGEPKPGMTLERIDNNSGYNPDNCRWANRFEQARNKRGLRIVTANGETHCLGKWAEITGLSVATLSRRVALGWTDSAVINQPKRGRSERDAA